MSDTTSAGTAEFFALRTPLLPFNDLIAWGDGLQAASAGDDPARLETAVAADRACLRQRLTLIYARPEVREALFLASPDLEQRLELWLSEPESEQGRKVERALVRYFVRMAGRSTPFGLFAGCSVGELGESSQLTLAERTRYRRHTRLDMDYLIGLTDALARQPDLRPRLAFTVNTSLYPAAGRVRYLDVRPSQSGWTHHQVALPATAYLTAVLARAEWGKEALTATLLQKEPDASPQDAARYFSELIDNQVLVSELHPALTGPEPIGVLTARLGKLSAGVADRLNQGRQEMEAIDAGGLGAEPARYRHVARLLESLPGEVHLGRLFQVDMVKPVERASLGAAVLAEIRRGVALLHRLACTPSDDRLMRFREAFVSRYEGQEVPLIEALDPYGGVGFGASATEASALLDGLTFPKATPRMVPWGRPQAVLLRKLNEALTTGAAEIALQPHDLENLAEPAPPPLPDAFAVMCAVAATSEASLARGDFQVLLHGSCGPSGARLLARFCHAEPELRRHVEKHLRDEEALQPDAVFAEIVHLPEGRLGNVLARPVLRAHEIPFLGRSGVPAARQIPIADLLVSVVEGQIVLRSARLARRVIPRLSSAHNFDRSEGIYAFLCALQNQDTASDLAWDWGPLGAAPFLPRVTAGRLVLCRASWRATQRELRLLSRERGAARFFTVQRWRAARRLPRWVALADDDNELPIDLDNALAVDVLVDLVKEREQATFVELFPGPDQLWVRGPEGRFVHELVVPFLRKDEGRRIADYRLPRNLQSAICNSPCFRERSFPPGSEWLYAKLYTGAPVLDEVLRDVVGPVVEAAQQTGAADRWFFVRYGDPDWHLRLRLHGQPARLIAEVLPALRVALEPLLEDGRAWRLQLDTYQQEVERYGGPEGVVLTERIFHADSEAVLALLPLLAEDVQGELRWRLACAGMHLLLTDLGFDLSTRRAILRTAQKAFATEFGADGKLRYQLGIRFRSERKSLESLLKLTAATEPWLASGLEILRRRSERLAPLMAKLRDCVPSGRLLVPLSELAHGYLHMHANRLFPSAQRAHELVLYDFLLKHYQSQAARAGLGSSLSSCCRGESRPFQDAVTRNPE